MHCYCRFQQKNQNTLWPDGEEICNKIKVIEQTSRLSSFFMPVILLVISVISKQILRKLVILEKRQNRAERTSSSAHHMFILSFINIGLVIFAVNFKFDGINENMPVFTGEHGAFNESWYDKIGSTIIVTVFLLVFSSNIENLMLQLLHLILRWFDRGWGVNIA